jgi:hypothetical protein
MIRNNFIFHRALVDFSYLVKDVPRGTALEGKLNYFDYFYTSFMNFEGVQMIFSEFPFNYLWLIGIIFVISIGVTIKIEMNKKKKR